MKKQWLDRKIYQTIPDLYKPWFDEIFVELKEMGVVDLIDFLM